MFLSLPASSSRRLVLYCGSLVGVVLLAGCALMKNREESALDAKVDGLLAQMTLDEKIGQMVQVDSLALPDKSDVAKYFLGSVLSGGSSDPDDGNSPQSWLKSVEAFKAASMQTRLKIPILYGIDAVHGHLSPRKTRVAQLKWNKSNT